jgi:hypothetical protein
VTEVSPERLEREARIFTAALVGGTPTRYVMRQYARGHMSLPLAPIQGFDVFLVGVARGGPTLARAADAYARLFAKRSILRRKLALMLAILESTAPYDQRFNPVAASAAGTLVRMAFAGVAAAAFTVLGVAVLAPLHLVSLIAAGRS